MGRRWLKLSVRRCFENHIAILVVVKAATLLGLHRRVANLLRRRVVEEIEKTWRIGAAKVEVGMRMPVLPPQP